MWDCPWLLQGRSVISIGSPGHQGRWHEVSLLSQGFWAGVTSSWFYHLLLFVYRTVSLEKPWLLSISLLVYQRGQLAQGSSGGKVVRNLTARTCQYDSGILTWYLFHTYVRLPENNSTSLKAIGYPILQAPVKSYHIETILHKAAYHKFPYKYPTIWYTTT